MDGHEGWTVVDDCDVEHRRAGEYLRSVVDRGGSIGTARSYAGRLALWLGWAAISGVDECGPSVEQLAAFARWLDPPHHRPHARPNNHRGSVFTRSSSQGVKIQPLLTMIMVPMGVA